MKRCIRIACAGLLCLSLAAPAQRKKDQEPETQTLVLPPDPPAVLRAETARLAFAVAPMTAKGLLSQQTREQVKWILSRYGKERIVKIRAFVAGSGDLRRVQAVVSEMFAEKRLPLPVLSVVLVGALPMTGAQVQMEVIVELRKTVNPNGIAFIAGQLVQSGPDSRQTVALGRDSLERVKQAIEAAGETALAARRITCFLSSIDAASELQQAASAIFPKTPLTLIQAQRANAAPFAECEAVASLSRAPANRVVRINPEGLAQTDRYSHVVATNAQSLAIAGSQMAFNFEDADAKLAFERLDRTLVSAGSSLKRTLMIDAYPLSRTLAGLIRKYWFEFLDSSAPPASTLMVVEGLPSMDAAFALEVAALPEDTATAQ